MGSSDDTKVELRPRGVVKQCGKCGKRERMKLRPTVSLQTATWIASYHDGRLCGSCGHPATASLYGFDEQS